MSAPLRPMREAFERLEVAWLQLDLAVKRAIVSEARTRSADPRAHVYEAMAVACAGVACDALEAVAELVERQLRQPTAAPPGEPTTHRRGP